MSHAHRHANEMACFGVGSEPIFNASLILFETGLFIMPDGISIGHDHDGHDDVYTAQRQSPCSSDAIIWYGHVRDLGQHWFR